MTDNIDFEEDADALEVSEEQLQEISALAAQQLKLEALVAKREAALKEAKRDLLKMQTDTLPNALKAAGCAAYTLTNGAAISVEDKMSMSVPKKNKHECAQWLIQHGGESLVKRDIHVPFNKGQDEDFNFMIEVLHANELDGKYSVEEGFSTTSAKAFIKELLEQGKEVPTKLFGVYQHQEAVIKLPE